jgi:hypothetical protein
MRLIRLQCATAAAGWLLLWASSGFPQGNGPAGKPLYGTSKLAEIRAEAEPSPAAFAAKKLKETLEDRGWVFSVDPRERRRPQSRLLVRLATNTAETAREFSATGFRPLPPLGPEAFAIRTLGGRRSATVWVVGGDPAGTMYGGLELAERIRAGADPLAIQDIDQHPRFAIRGVKINLRWISYRKHECLQLHDATCRDPEFWRALIDHLAECRFNRLSLWSLHPWCLMVRPTDFPEACDLSDSELARWRALWQGIFAHAHARGMKVQMFTWNIFVSPAFAKAHNVATYSIPWNFFGAGDTSDLVRRYNRAVVAQVLREYPDLDGLGITQSERMGGMTPEERGQWIAAALLPAVKDAGRPVEINYRIPHSANKGSGGSTSRQSELLGRRLLEAVDLPGPIWSEVKYNWSHGHSTPKLCLIHGGPPTDALWNPPPEKYRITWMVRNEDFFCLRWCAPSFVRAHVRENDRPWTGGYYIGSECYIPAQNYIDRSERDSGARWAFQRQRLFYLVWGRLLYDPALTDEGLARAIDGQYGRGIGAALLPGLDRGGQTPLRIATFCGATWDHTLYSEGFLRNDGFITVDRLIAAQPLDPAWMGVAEYVKATAGGKAPPADRTTPLQVADAAEADAQAALKLLAPLGRRSGAIAEEIADATVWAHLGLYLADKLRAAVALERFRTGDDPRGQARAVELLERCVQHWDAVVAATKPRFREVPLQHTGSKKFSWAAYREDVVRDVQRAR